MGKELEELFVEMQDDSYKSSYKGLANNPNFVCKNIRYRMEAMEMALQRIAGMFDGNDLKTTYEMSAYAKNALQLCKDLSD